ncbi:MAG: DUF1573 domain-containing protein [Flavobacteriales bacterium]|nr:DUF1573 domain-containing protein [Flavobacteriales bacterium]
MKSILFFVFIISPFGLLAQAKLFIPETVHYFDTLRVGDRCEHYFYIRNTGNEPLLIQSVNTSCGCDVADWPKEPIEPKSYAYIHYKYDSKRIGIINRSMTIKSNDPENPIIVVKVKGFVSPVSD